MSPLLVGIFLLIIGYKLYEFLNSTPKNIPPSLPRLPVIGSYWHLLWHNYTHPFKTVLYYAHKLRSSIVTCYLGNTVTIIASDYSSVKDILTREEFDGRLMNLTTTLSAGYGKPLGIFFIEGPVWQEQRRFMLRHMRDFGFGRRHEKYEANMLEEMSILVNMLKDGPINDKEKEYLKNGYALFPDVLYPCVTNSIWDIFFGERFNRSEHDQVRYLCKAVMLLQKSGDITGGAIAQFSFLKHFGNMFKYRDFSKSNHEIFDFIKKHIEKQRHFTEDDMGLVSRYLKEIEGTKDATSSFTMEQLVVLLGDLMLPSLSVMPSVIVHAIKCAMHNPKVVKNVQNEIDRVVGTGRLITWEDRKNLTYTEATVRETLRYETVTPFGVFHKALKDTTLSGFDVPKDAAVVTNLTGLNNDPDLWGDPENFRPERFLNEKGELGKDYTFPFGLGHRVCAGETFARYIVFQTFATLMQNFDFSFVKGEPTGLDDKIIGSMVIPEHTWIRIEPR
ncbi:unnamed protein product [Xylocopa violacea]|uniref:Cytochrome P450 304a1 n=1 Tax=Xylocopa violacea TaxID=135666 RepID=A0ABP1NFG6_XYLVO